jgi:hypothetical protein
VEREPPSVRPVVKRKIRDILPFGGKSRVLRFSGSGPVPGADVEADARARAVQDQDDIHRALGRIAANWSLIEIASGLVLMSLVGSRDETLARAVVAGQRVENVWETVSALLASYGDDAEAELAAFQAWRRTANKCRRRRNEAIHSAWSLTPDGGGAAAWDVMSQRAKRGTRADLFPGGVNELVDLALDIAGCEERLTRIHADILALMDRRDGEDGTAREDADGDDDDDAEDDRP